nr:divergent PAP2 family protein [uncultured Pseudomonas sp.]
MDPSYLLMPFAAWLVAGSSKFLINCIRARRLAFDLVGYGGLPSNHSAIVGGMACLIALKQGIAHPAFGVALSLAFIVMLDAGSLRRQIGRQAEALNRLALDDGCSKLRERMGHSPLELFAGLAVGGATAWALDYLL